MNRFQGLESLKKRKVSKRLQALQVACQDVLSQAAVLMLNG